MDYRMTTTCLTLPGHRVVNNLGVVQHADQMGANAILAVKYDATDLGNNMTEVLAYGTAVVVQAE